MYDEKDTFELMQCLTVCVHHTDVHVLVTEILELMSVH